MASYEFDVNSYLKTYYKGLEHHPEIVRQLSFMLSATSHLRPNARVLDLASGPTVYQAAPAARVASSIILSDASPELLGHCERWRDGKSNAFNWDPHIKKTLDLEASLGIRSPDGLKERKEKMRRAIDFAIVDVLKPPQWISTRPFDLVQNTYLASACADSREEFLNIWKKCVSYTVPGGDLIIVEMCDAGHYVVGSSKTYAHEISYDEQVQLVGSLGCHVVAMEYVPSGDGGKYGYSGLALFHLRKPCQ